ncbi:MAG: double zinc ribbon domain-containing protein [Halobacteriota archaeon]
MSKITFRADEELVRRLEAFDASKSEVMREALRAYLDDAERPTIAGTGSVDDALVERIDQLIETRLDAHFDERPGAARARPASDVHVNVTLDGASVADDRHESATVERKTREEHSESSDESRLTKCGQCGDEVGASHVYCPNCGEKATHRVFCECGDELRSDWAFCPGCGRRTPAADVLERP